MANQTTKVRAAVVGLGWPGIQGIMLMQMLDGIYESAQKGRSVPIADLSVATG